MQARISPKARAKALYDSGRTSVSQISRGASVSERTAYRYLAAFKKGETHERKNYPQRKNSKKTQDVVNEILRLARDRRRIWSSMAIASKVNLSHTAVVDVLRDHQIYYQSYNRQLKLTPDTMKERKKFANQMKLRESDWGFVIFTDECSFFQKDTKPKKLWTGDPLKEKGTGTHGLKVHLWGGISAMGALRLEIFEDSMTALKLKNIMRSRLPQLNRMYPGGFIWQQDNSGVHRSNTVHKFIDKYMPQKLIWPSYSPDLSPIENVWKWLK